MLLDICNLSISAQTRHGSVALLKDFSLTMSAGERVGLVGESGCGKSITALAIMGLLPAALRPAGSLRFQGQELLTLSERDYWLLDRVGLPAPRFSPMLYPHQLSGGQRQRVVIAIALACEPTLLVADEPTTALDVVVQAQILELIMEAVTDAGMGLLLISHDLGVVAATTDRVCVMYAGRIVEQGATEALFARMAHPYTRGLFNAMPQWADAEGEASRRLKTIPGSVPEPGLRPPGCVFSDRCDYVRDRCRTEPPVLMPIADNHADTAACHYPLLESRSELSERRRNE